MRESIRGYADAVLETADVEGRAEGVGRDLSGLAQLVRSSQDLRAVLSDPGLPARARRSVVRDLLRDKMDPAVIGLVGFTVEVDRAPEIVADLDWLAAAAVAAGDERPDEVLGRSAAKERIDGYAEAVLGPVSTEGTLDEVEDELFRFARVVESSPELTAALTDRDRPASRRADLVLDLLGSRTQPATSRLAAYAARHGRPRDYLATLDWLVERVATESNRRVAEVRAAAELGDEQRRRLAGALARITGRPVEVRVSVDPSLLGGFVAAVGDTVIDGSARHRLEMVKERLSLPHAELTTGTTGEPR